MNNFVITFADVHEPNSELGVSIKSKLEDLSSGKWLQVFPQQIAIQTSLSIQEVANVLAEEAKQTRISIFKFSQWASNESRSENLMTRLF
ncbi:hypothetical protein LOSG293_110710 [Secundilactobacillus oryzae JCM 18671]|uniref:Uncharacterized protein n=1 Tax=Secundilactobacillus oryzae JCM 18671 TaxID=1291743 RepID=A0A081BI87_9LACO|nr:hypothetical protein [Secundilactobacillus oryzae]GAK47755.1 hypothetical protein LOSG293_110710 [Secundilactobacillus oryzae JCM 18671]